MTYTRIALSGAAPVSVAKAMRRLQIDVDGLDEEAVAAITEDVGDAIGTATEWLEDQTKLTLRPTTFSLTLDRWPCFPLMLEKAPVVDVESITYFDRDGVSRTFDPGVWTWMRTTTGARLYLVGAGTFPDIACRPDAITIQFDAGFETPGATGGDDDPALILPKAIETALILVAGHFYTHRDAVVDGRTYEVALGAAALVDTSRLWQ